MALNHSEVKSSSQHQRKLIPLDKTALVSLDSGVDSVSIQTELALEELREKHQEEIHQLTVKLETQMNYYKRHLEQMRSSMELERKDISQAFKMEICELEEQKSDLETQLKQLKENMEKSLHRQNEQWNREQEKRQQRERTEMEQNFAREISNLVQRLSAEKDQLEAELSLKMDQELLLVRTQMEELRSENCALQERLTLLQQEVAILEEDVTAKRKKLEEMQREQEQEKDQQEMLHKENADLRGQILDLSRRNLELSDTNAELSSNIRGHQESLVMIQNRLKIVSQEQEEHSATVQRLKEDLIQTERDKQQRLNSWNKEKHHLQIELTSNKTKIGQVSKLESELQSLGLKFQWSQDDNERLKRESDMRRRQVEELESCLAKFVSEKEEVTSSLEAELQQLRIRNQQLNSMFCEVQAENLQSKKLNQEQMELRTQLDKLQSAKKQAEDQALRADTALSLVQAQHLRQIHQIQESRSESKAESSSSEELDSALKQLRYEQQKRERLEHELSEREMTVQQGQWEKATSLLQLREENLEMQLKATRLLLQEKITELQYQVSRSVDTENLVQRLYLENSELQGALQVTELRHRQAEKKSQVLESKVQALNRLLRQLVPHAMA